MDRGIILDGGRENGSNDTIMTRADANIFYTFELRGR
jgi:hypothetical protein